jgi:2-polyprenyl-3-methyl-5-hydroxy-6-metoxy-1,4-benzoquinol methylase
MEVKQIELQQPGIFDDEIARAAQSEGESEPAVHGLIARVVEALGIRGEVLIDVGCGRGKLWPRLRVRFARCIGVDAVRYPGLPSDIELCETRLDSPTIPLPDAVADLVVCSETIEHVENPRALMRELGRLAEPGAWLIVTTPNQLSLSSLMTLLVKHRFACFQDVHYPAHLTALLEVDLTRMATECSLADARIEYTMSGRIPFTGRHYPKFLSRIFPRALSDNILLAARKPLRPRLITDEIAQQS